MKENYYYERNERKVRWYLPLRAFGGEKQLEASWGASNTVFVDLGVISGVFTSSCFSNLYICVLRFLLSVFSFKNKKHKLQNNKGQKNTNGK